MSSKNNALKMKKTKNKLYLDKNTSNEQNNLFKFFPNNSQSTNKSLNNISPSHNNNQLKNGINSNIKPNTMLGPLKGENDPEKQLLYYFKDKKIYIEIFNGNLNASKIFYDILLKYKIIQCKKLHKKIDYIVFKDGHLKTKKYAVLNNIKMVNPLWVDDKVNKHIFKDDKEYEIKTNFGDIVLREKYQKEKDKDKEKDKEKEKDNDDILNKNYEHELEVEYDIEYANKIDKLRENNSQNNNDSVESTINSQNKEKFNIETEKDITENNLENYRKKRKSSTNNKLENRITINEKKDNSKKKENKIKKSLNSKDNNKNGKKKGIKKNKKSKSTDNVHNDNNESIKEAHKNKKKDIDDGNYILDFDQNSSKGLILSTKKNNIQTISDKINIATYKLEEDEIQCLKTLPNFEYKGNLCNNENDKNIYNNASIIIVEYKKVIYDWKIYEFFFDKKIIVDFTSFLFEFINGGDNSKKGFDLNIILEKINEISINNETYFFNKKKRNQKRSILQSLNIVDNIIMKDKKEISQASQQQNDIENKFFFILNQDIDDNEKKILIKLSKNYLKANIINNNMPKKRSRSFANQINLNLEKLTKKNKKNNLEVIKEKDNIDKDDSNRIEEEKDLKEMDNSIDLNIKRIYNNNKENIIYKNEGDKEEQNDRTFFISKEKVNNIKFLKKVKYYKGIISYKYIYDSFLNGKLLDLDNLEIFNKYKLQ